MDRDALRRWSINGLAIAVLGTVIVLGWRSDTATSPPTVGSLVPEYSAPDLEGRSVSLESLRGRVVVFNIWATWCPPCRWEMPAMERLHRMHAKDGLEVVAVSVDAAPGEFDRAGRPGGDIAAMVEELELGFTILHDPRGEVMRLFGAQGLPTTFLIDRDGRIVRRVLGPVHWDAPPYLDLIRELLEG